ncbi:hypothetical protein C8R45DRAFT_948223 [Mycena sanguinolenta]|nr:hypothetical protein C8R45DRAFT_948223 [Mycena sanguinolenta]
MYRRRRSEAGRKAARGNVWIRCAREGVRIKRRHRRLGSQHTWMLLDALPRRQSEFEDDAALLKFRRRSLRRVEQQIRIRSIGAIGYVACSLDLSEQEYGRGGGASAVAVKVVDDNRFGEAAMQ